MLTADRLRQLLSYDPSTGIFRWRVSANGGGNIYPGKVAGNDTPRGCRQITVDGVSYLAHRLAWLYVRGAWPSGQVDHRDRNRSNNAISNLREATHGQNRANSKVNKNNLAGLKGVGVRRNRRFQASIKANGQTVYLGRFGSAEEAHAAYIEAAKRLHGEFARSA